MTTVKKFLLVSLVLVCTSLVVYSPHFENKLPILGDEYYHIALTQLILFESEGPFSNPYFLNNPTHNNFEFGFHYILAGITMLTGTDLVTTYNYLGIIFFIVNSTLVYYLTKLWTSRFTSGLFAAFFYGLIPSTSGLIAHNYFVPLVFGSTLLLLLCIVGTKLVKCPSWKDFLLLGLVLIVTAGTYPPAVFFFGMVSFLYLLTLDHDVHKKLNLESSTFITMLLGGTLLLSATGFLLLQKLDLLSEIVFLTSWDVIQARISPLSYTGWVAGILFLIGLFTVLRSNHIPRFIIFWIVYGICAIYLYYLLGASYLVPFPRLFVFYMIGFSICVGIGLTSAVDIIKTKRPTLLRGTAASIIVLIIGSFQIHQAVAHTPHVNTILNTTTYHYLLSHFPTRDSDTTIIADSNTSMGIYPAVGASVVSLLSGNLSGGYHSEVVSILNQTCELKKASIGKIFMNQNHVVDKVFVFSKRKQDCSFLESIDESGPFLYRVSPELVAQATHPDFPLLREYIPKTTNYIPPEGVPLLEGENLKNIFAGNTHTHSLDGLNVEYFDSGGVLRGKENIYYTGLWEVNGPVYCYYYPQNDFSECNLISQRKNELDFYYLDGSFKDTATFEKGNPHNL